MKKLSSSTLQHLPHHWGQLSGPRKVWFLNSCNCSPVLESWWGILSSGELQLFAEYQTLTPEFIYRNWKHFNPLIRLTISQHQTLPEHILIQMWDSLTITECHSFCIRLDVSREFMTTYWHRLPEYVKVEYFIHNGYGKSLPKGELPMFLSDSNTKVREAASRYLKAWIYTRLLWKVTYYLERYICYVIPNRWRSVKVAYRRRRN